MSGFWRGLGAVLLGAQLAGCAALSLLESGPAPTTYDLSARAGVKDLAAPDARLGIRVPNAVQTFDNQRIVFRPERRLVAYYADSQWTDRLPKLIEAQLVVSFDAAGARTVTRTTDALTVDYQLLSEVRDFSVHRSGTKQSARVSIYVQLVSDSKGRTLTGRLFTARVPVSRKAGSEDGVRTRQPASPRSIARSPGFLPVSFAGRCLICQAPTRPIKLNSRQES